ncbi:MAG: 4-(cytidine 5'-diphospho)-2-C-methyl-D-erythritol kinase [Ruminococcaceae bacterium]|nr:4-(cytidine 5'-diphospho)-2-C-methyl-D-erythritol kinase [Oscillospiraceae bacterium]
MERTEAAYAKLNLYLDVTAKRPDGFHDLKSVMHTVTLADTVTVNAKLADYSCVTVEMVDSDIPADERNLAYLAAEAFLEETGITAAVSVRVEKRIPACAGLGGGSADCAAVLRALNTLFAHPLSKEALLALGARLGADVPFCILGGTRLCEGKGEQMQNYSMENMHFVIAVPEDEWVQTPKAYAMLDEAFDDYKNEDSALHDTLFSFFEEDGVYGMYNVFESVVLPLSPKASALRSHLISLGARAAMMTGSGAAVFGVFDSPEAAAYAAEDIEGAILCESAPAYE